MSDRKYRQRGYQDEPRERTPPRQIQQDRTPGRQLQDASGPKTPRLMASHEVVRCANCGTRLPLQISAGDACPQCRAALHACAQCAWFDPSQRWECGVTTLAERVLSKQADNNCSHFTARTRVERETGSTKSTSDANGASGGPRDARQAFEDLFRN